jgi:Zn ribbon nucleic-acid-binding protein
MKKLFPTAEPLECGTCGSASITTKHEAQEFDYGVEPETVRLRAVVPMRHCGDCGFTFTDADAEVARHETICRHLR